MGTMRTMAHGWVYSFIVLVVPSEQRANKTFRLLKANVFMQLVYGAYNVVHIRTQVKVCNCVLYLVERTFWKNQLPTMGMDV
jgi:hypothetical protein